MKRGSKKKWDRVREERKRTGPKDHNCRLCPKIGPFGFEMGTANETWWYCGDHREDGEYEFRRQKR